MSVVNRLGWFAWYDPAMDTILDRDYMVGGAVVKLYQLIFEFGARLIY